MPPVVVFYDLNGYEFEYEDESIRRILKQFASNAVAVNIMEVAEYPRNHTEPVEE